MSQITTTSTGMSLGAVMELTGNSGGPVLPTAGNINTIGAGNITVTGNPGTSTLTWTLIGTTNHAIQLGNSSGSLSSLTVGTTGQMLIGNSAADPSWMAAGTNGQVVIAATGASPAFASLTSTGGTITFTTGANSLNLEASGTSVIHYISTSTTPYVALSTDYYISIDASGGAKTVQLPNAPSTGRVFVVKDQKGNAASNNITVTTVGGVVTIDGATSFVMNTAYESVQVIFNGTSYEVW